MAQAVVSVEGGRQLRASMRRAGVDVTQLKETHKEVAGVVTRAGQPSTPRRSGKLASSVRPGATQTAAIVRAGGARIPYANAIHWGYKKRNIAAQPWLSDAARKEEPRWFGMYTEEIEAILNTIRGI
ncbi:hypothetical protein [Tomitella biformata]|uniref:hypothetical protein n=1 Tax=Tomitella biformata TaxID=630403 RepID=UPI00046664BB|nr:hypothetical protein [Tomitella biformata]